MKSSNVQQLTTNRHLKSTKMGIKKSTGFDTVDSMRKLYYSKLAIS